MFFHPQQGEHESSINASILSYGFPKIIQESAYLRIGIEGKEVQTLYAFVHRGKLEDLAGVIVYTRTSPDTLALLHMAVKPEYSYADGYKTGPLQSGSRESRNFPLPMRGKSYRKRNSSEVHQKGLNRR